MTKISLVNVGKSYRRYSNNSDRFWGLLTNRTRYAEHYALHPISFEINNGEVLGIIGVNGAGKSTLLKLIAGTMLPSFGDLQVEGKVCALLELGSGFHPEMSGRENISLGGAVAGLSTTQVAAVEDEIIEFSGLRKVIDSPIKTYSSGMVMRLAFSVATAIDPDILILDETLSVGDGAFAKKSFEKIMGFKESGKTILFCSHSMYQTQAICTKVLWLDEGKLKQLGDPSQVIGAYNDFLAGGEKPEVLVDEENYLEECEKNRGLKTRLLNVKVSSNGVAGHRLAVESGYSDVVVEITFIHDENESIPNVGIVIQGANGRAVTSCSTISDRVEISIHSDGTGKVSLRYPKIPLLKGSYWVNVHLMCEKGIFFYDRAKMVAELIISQTSLEQGVVALPHEWSVGARK